ncbi:MAG TPA: carboxymuconolactone decarboxylase family protein [Nevskiaceae bacterium]|nr:carboxymuconolactone decarboxylase family protein [Nevskiaceae bacterium]
MTSARIAPLDPPYTAEMQADFDKVMRGLPPLKLFRTVGRNPRVLSRLIAGGLLDRGSISLRARELMILRTCARCGAEYEWGVHVAAYNTKAGFTPEQLHASVHGDAAAPVWTREDAAVVKLADALHEKHDVNDALWGELKSVYADDQLIELVMLAGLYRAVSYLINATRLEREAMAPRFPAA